MGRTVFFALAIGAFGAWAAPGDKAGVILDAHPEWIGLRDRAVAIARTHVEKIGDWKPQLCCMPGKGIIWVWDSCFMSLYAGYAPGKLNGQGNLDNLYAMQGEDGYVGMAYRYSTGKACWGERVNPPLFAWVEWLYARRTGDLSRLPRAYDASSRLFRWLKAHRRRANGSYYFEDTGSSGMDNSPRSGYYAKDLAGSDVCFVDLACQQVLAARSLAKIAAALGKTADVAGWEEEADDLSGVINAVHWSESTGFYHDSFVSTNNRLGNKTVAGFWPIVAGVARGARLARLVEHLTNPLTFGARHPVPSLSRDDPNFRSDGGYWLGSVWPPTNYMIVNGLREAGYRDLAREIAVKHLDCMTELLGTENYDTIWECYSPDFPAPGTNKQYGLCVRDFVGWGGLGPIVMLVEDVIGLDLDALHGKVTWHLSETGRQGVTDVPFNGGSLSLECRVENVNNFTCKVTTDRPFRLEIVSPNGLNRTVRRIDPGTVEF